MAVEFGPIITAVGGTFTICGSIAGLGWWLSRQFRKVEKGQETILDAHEAKDQERHEENLERFTQIKIALARLGYKNGSAPL
jgi:hypothetical protein